MKKIFVTRKVPIEGLEKLKESFEVKIFQEDRQIEKHEIIELAQDCDALLCMLTDKIDAEVMDKLKLKIIANYAVGYDNIDVKEATKRNIAVTNTPGVLTEATADLTFALILSLSRKIIPADQFMRNKQFKCWEPMLYLGGDFFGKKIGIIGFGRIGQAVAKRAKGFGMDILYYSRTRYEDVEKELDAKSVTLEELMKESDYVTVHCPYSPSTHHLVSKEMLHLMKPSAYFINTARGKIVDEFELINLLKERKIAGAGLDVYYDEPIINEELFPLDNTVLLPHIGSASMETRIKMAEIASENISNVLNGATPPNLLNQDITL